MTMKKRRLKLTERQLTNITRKVVREEEHGMEKNISRDEIIEILNEIYELQLEKAPAIAQRRLDELFEKIGIGYWSYPSPMNEQWVFNPCDWSNYPAWVSTWTNNTAFQNVNNNPNQPCNHICGRLQTWNANLITAGSAQWEQLRCKILEGENQATIHGCPC